MPMHFFRMLHTLMSFLENMGAGRDDLGEDNTGQSAFNEQSDEPIPEKGCKVPLIGQTFLPGVGNCRLLRMEEVKGVE